MRKIAITILGVAIIALGIAAIPLPGPGFLIMVVGFWVLSLEYEWAKRRLDKMQGKAIEGAHASVETKPRIAMSMLLGLGLIAAGVVWGLYEELPFSSWWSGGSTIGGGVLAIATTVWAIGDLRKKRKRDALSSPGRTGSLNPG